MYWLNVLDSITSVIGLLLKISVKHVLLESLSCVSVQF
jgi:hypothetical protein